MLKKALQGPLAQVIFQFWIIFPSVGCACAPMTGR
jgi:hypothetical protein